MATAMIAWTGCSSEAPGEPLAAAELGLGAGEFALINEVELNPPGGDAPWQYIEIEGTPGASLAGVQMVVAEGAGAASVEMVVNLGAACGGACTIGTNGIFMIKAADSGVGSVGHTPAAGTNVFKDAQLSMASLTTNNTAVLLVQGPAILTEGSALARGDGGFAVLPAGDSLLDGVGWGGGGTLAGVTLSQTTGFPDAATRFPGRRDRTAAAWYGGNLAGASNSVTYATAAAQRTANFPSGGALTPGAPNVPTVDDAGLEAGDAATDAQADAPPQADVQTDAQDAAEASADVAADAPAVDAPPDAPIDRADATTDARAEASDAPNDVPAADQSIVDARADQGDAGGGGAGGAAGSGGAAGEAGSAGSAGSAGAGGSGGTAGSGGRAGTAGSAGQAGASGSGVAPPAAGDDGGCGCRLSAPVHADPRGALALIGLASILVRRARRRRTT
jgi:MYXO-CTERM domain-containing protein